MTMPQEPNAGGPTFDGQPAAPQSRMEEFGHGVNGTGDVASSLDQDAVRFNAQVPHGFTPESILTEAQLFPSVNGMSEQDASRRMIGDKPGQPSLPSQNATSQSSYQPSTMLKIRGDQYEQS